MMRNRVPRPLLVALLVCTLWTTGAATQLGTHGELARAAPAARTAPLAYGFQGDFFQTATRPRAIGWITEAGFGWAKQQVRWSEYELQAADCTRDPGNCLEHAIGGRTSYFKRDQLGFLDAVVDDLSGAGLGVLLSVVSAPAFAATPGGHAPADPNELRDFVQFLAGRYRGKVKAMEPWNEQNLAWEWGGARLWPNAPDAPPQGVVDFVALQRAAYGGIKAGDPGIIVVLPALTPTGLGECWLDPQIRSQDFCLEQVRTAIDDQLYLDFLYQVNNAEITRYYDVLGVHPSGYNNPPDDFVDTKTVPSVNFKGHGSFYVRRYEQLRQVQLRHGDTKPMWFTELGWPVTRSAVPGYEFGQDNTEASRGAYIARLLEQVHGEAPYVTAVFLWNLNFRQLVPEADEKYGFGLIDPDGGRTPGYVCAADFVQNGGRISRTECRLPGAATSATAVPPAAVAPSATATATATPPPTATEAPPPSATSAPTATATPLPTATEAPTATPPAAATPLPTATETPPLTATATPLPTATAAPPTASPLSTATPLPTATETLSLTATAAPTATESPSPTATPATQEAPPTATPASTAMLTPTATLGPTAAPPPTSSPTQTAAPPRSATPAPTATPLPSATTAAAGTPAASATPPPTPGLTATAHLLLATDMPSPTIAAARTEVLPSHASAAANTTAPNRAPPPAAAAASPPTAATPAAPTAAATPSVSLATATAATVTAALPATATAATVAAAPSAATAAPTRASVGSPTTEPSGTTPATLTAAPTATPTAAATASGTPAAVTTATPAPTTAIVWATRAPLPTARGSMAVTMGNGTVFAARGLDLDGHRAVLKEYDPAANRWVVHGSMPSARNGFALVRALNGRLYAIGGRGRSGVVGTLEEFDPTTGRWVARASMPTARERLAAAAGTNGRLYAIGGQNSSGHLATVEEYDPATDSWTTKAALPTARAGLAAAAIGRRIYAVGGAHGGAAALGTVEEYDPAADAWRPRASMPTARRDVAVAASLAGRLYAAGGSGPTGGRCCSGLAIVEEYEPALDVWAGRAPISVPRESLGLAAAANGKLYAIGAAAGSALLEVEEATITP